MKRLLIAVLVLMLLLVVACEPTEPQQQGTTDEEENDATGPTGDTEDADENEAADVEDEDDAEDILDDYFEVVGGDAEFKISYDVTSSAAPNVISKMTMAVKGVNKMRVDTEAEAEGQIIKATVYVVNKEYVSCTEFQGSKNCIKLEVPATKSTEEINADMKANPAKYKVTAKGTKTIIGKTAKCFGIVYTEQAEVDMELCYADNVPLYVKTVASGYTTEMTATSYEGSVPDSWFTLPETTSTVNVGEGMTQEDIDKLVAQYS